MYKYANKCCPIVPGCSGGTGPTGMTGPTGQDGFSGPGPQGLKGDPGRPGSLIFTGHGAPVVFPANGTNHMYLDVDTGNVYIYSMIGWVPNGNIKGPTGPTGTTGPKGDQGQIGATGPTGPSSGSNFGMASYTFRTDAFATNVLSPLAPFNGAGYLNGTITTYTPPQLTNANITISWNVAVQLPLLIIDAEIELATFISVNGNNPYHLSSISSTIVNSNINLVLTDVIFIENLQHNYIYSVIPRWYCNRSSALSMFVANLNHYTMQVEFFE